jgi:hypothetical protein
MPTSRACQNALNLPNCKTVMRPDPRRAGGCQGTSRTSATIDSYYGGRSKGVFDTLTYPHLILPYSAYYGRLTSHYGSPWCSPITWWCDKKHLQRPAQHIYVQMVGLTILSVLNRGSLHTKPPPYDFLNLYGACLQAPRTPKLK